MVYQITKESVTDRASTWAHQNDNRVAIVYLYDGNNPGGMLQCWQADTRPNAVRCALNVYLSTLTTLHSARAYRNRYGKFGVVLNKVPLKSDPHLKRYV